MMNIQSVDELLLDAKRYRERAEECRLDLDDLQTKTRVVMLQTADDYDRIASSLEKMAASLELMHKPFEQW